MSALTTDNSKPEPVADVAQAVEQLRALVCGLGVMVLVLSVSFNLFVWKQNRNLSGTINARTSQLSLGQTNLTRMASAANDLANYSTNKPELYGIFKRYGIELKNTP
jgi:hypothetical protein